MDIVAIESKTFEQMKGRFEDFTRQIKNLCGENQDKEKWLGNDDVCSHVEEHNLGVCVLSDVAYGAVHHR